MEQVEPSRSELSSGTSPHTNWRLGSILLGLTAATLLLFVLYTRFTGKDIPLLITLFVVVVFCGVVLLGTLFLVRALREHRESDERFQQMASNIREIFWMLDTETKQVLYVNEAYETVTGRSRKSLTDDPTSCHEIIHPDDHTRILAKLEKATRTGQFNERFRIICAHGQVRWVHVHGFPVHNSAGRLWRLVGTAQEITQQKQAEDEVVRNLAIAEAARAEAEALRKATLALTQDLHMDFVLEALLRSLEELVPYTCARVLVPEGGPHVLALGERECPQATKASPRRPLTLISDKSPFLQRVLNDRKTVLISDTMHEEEWRTFQGHSHLRSWVSVPLIAYDEYLGFLSIGHTEPNRYTQEHLRRAELLAVPAAAAIQNARTFARAEIYASELEKRFADLRNAEAALARAEVDRRTSEEKFQTVFRLSPIPFSITTVADGRFIDVNAAFEMRYGYSRQELIGRTVHELKIWEDPADRALMVQQLTQGSVVQNVITRLRTKSGEIKLTAYSANWIQFDGQPCILATSEDLPKYEPKKMN